jgi:seryl-tRNA synthetase
LFQSRNELENEMKIKIKLSRTPRRLVNSNTETSIMGDKRNVKKIKNEFQKKKEEYDNDITLLLNEQEELKKTLSQLESNENKMISKINYQIYKIKNLENDIEKYKLHESEIKNKIQDIPRNSNK